MKTFEERLAAWLEGRLTGRELAAFERELEANPEAVAETEADRELGNLLRAHLTAPPLGNADFFNHQLLRQIEADPQAPARAARRPLFWSLRRMVYSGAFCLLLATALYFAAVPRTRRQMLHNELYVHNVLNASATDPSITASEVVHVRSDDPNVTATCFHSKDNDVNVVWLDGLSYLPRDHKLK
ncbi:MAG TPA: hypothetical protein VHY22_07505 [Chthoniobacteraceae bacterium]|jgi:anti-sigma factor RsiW|nr:hypothetical protein [Chthoniobacteraceae bacterium]